MVKGKATIPATTAAPTDAPIKRTSPVGLTATRAPASNPAAITAVTTATIGSNTPASPTASPAATAAEPNDRTGPAAVRKGALAWASSSARNTHGLTA